MSAAHLRTRIAQLDVQILEQRRVLHELQQTRSDVERELYATATFPVETLPTEIIAEIFLHCLPLLGILRFPGGETSAAIVLSSVSRVWRQIAHATPALWSNLRVEFDASSQPGLLEGLTDIWLSRARSCPVSLDFRCPQDSDEPFKLSRLRDIIHRWAHRVEFINLDLEDPADIRALGLDSASFPLLQRATVGCYDDRPDFTRTTLFGNAPCLHDLRVGFGVFQPGTLKLPWPQLTKFQGTLYDLKMFTAAPNLTELTCQFDPTEADFPVTTHHNLTSLTLLLNCDDILHYLTLPALRHLDISQMPSYTSLRPFIARSSPPLVSLSARIDEYEHYFDNLQGVLPLVARTLQKLEFSSIHADQLPYILSLNPDCYNIRTMVFEAVSGTVDLHSLPRFLYARTAQLRTFRLVWQESPFLDGEIRAGPLDTLDTIGGHLSQLGMDIYLGTLDKNYVPVSGSTIEQNSLH
ncbi:hypothetical protein C8R45DRAFT_207976 [Mycena sanguinolenta]|nr:hypothetical protein C8R45DRAFT_207976 [Mycena sanguinolenta]